MKGCNTCGVEKAHEEFYTKRRARPNGSIKVYLEGTCKTCLRDAKRKDRICLACKSVWQHIGSSGVRNRFCPECTGKWRCCSRCSEVLALGDFYENNPLCKPCAQEYNRAILYGLAPGEYAAMKAEQGGACAICKATDTRLVVDHDHGTGAVRGLLCGFCNSGLGYFRDSPTALTGAIQYLDAGRG